MLAPSNHLGEDERALTRGSDGFKRKLLSILEATLEGAVMPAQVAIVHGWSDSSESFHTLRDFLEANEYQATQIWLADYISADDDVRIEDVGKRMESVIGEAIRTRRLMVPFDLIVHSTGGLVAREWISRFYPRAEACPVKRLIMLAPANFGSRLATLGKSMIGRVLKGWNNWTGTQTLLGLELASPYQWDLARRDLFDAGGNDPGPYGRGKVWPFVIVGSRGYSDGLSQIVNENGSDGIMRCAAANLNAVGMTIDFTDNPTEPPIHPWHWRAEDVRFPLAVLPDRDHSSIHEPASPSGATSDLSDQLGKLILEALSCDTDGKYAAMYGTWNQVSEATYQLSQNGDALKRALPNSTPDFQALHQYFQVIVFVRDDQHQPVTDYFLEFFPPNQADDAASVYFHQHVLDDVHVNSQTASRRCLFVDRTDLMLDYYPRIPTAAKQQVAVSISAAQIGPNVRYFDSTKTGARGHLVVHRKDDARREQLPARLHRNTTHLVEIVIPRQPIQKVFKISQ